MSKSFDTRLIRQALLNVNLRKFVVFYKLMFNFPTLMSKHFGSIFAA